jgi:hypothetical protein
LIQKFSAALETVVGDICAGSTGQFIKRLPTASPKHQPKQRA